MYTSKWLIYNCYYYIAILETFNCVQKNQKKKKKKKNKTKQLRLVLKMLSKNVFKNTYISNIYAKSGFGIKLPTRVELP